ncbi:MAG: O-antigen ligase family protein [Candidatus Paceibacterota bacterium]
MIFNRLKHVFLIGFCLIVTLPLLSLQPWFSPPDWGKTIVFRIVLSILIFLFFWQVFLNKNQEVKEKISFLFSRKNTVFWLLVFLFSIYFLATIFSLDPNFSLWGSPYRSGGFINFTFYIVFGILAFLVLKKEDWQKVWNVAIITGVLVSFVAILQWQGLLKDFLVTYETRPPSTLGNPIMLALYLLFLSFLTLPLAVKATPLYRKLLYFSAFFIFIFTILLTYSRAAYLGLAVGFLYFILAYPFKRRIVSLILRVAFLAILALGTCGVYYINTHPKLPDFIHENKTLRLMAGRFSIEEALQDARISGWKVSWQALRDRPILGHGPENFAIGFDKYYDPSLTGIEKMPGSFEGWWDRAHNFVFDISATVGIPALIIYFALFGALFRQLQKIKKEGPPQTLICHGIQSAFIGYLVANFFSFDTFSIYLILFLLIGYTLHLSFLAASAPEISDLTSKKTRRYAVLKLLLLILLIWFIWSFNIKPFQINSQINIAGLMAKEGMCDAAVQKMESILPEKSFLDNYARLKYIEIINRCIEEKEMTEAKDLTEKAINALEEATKIMPYYTRTWILLGQYNNLLMENWQEDREEEARAALEKALALSPKRQEAFQELIKTNLLTGKYKEALEESEECIKLNEKFTACYWLGGLSNIYLNDLEKADNYMQTATKMRYPTKTKESWLQLTKAYIEIKNYDRLVKTYSALIKLEPDNPQHYASLAFVYKELNQTEQAKKTALKIIELFPEYETQTEEFLRTLE